MVIRQFDVCRNSDKRSRKYAPYFVVLQADILDVLDTVVVAPALPDRLPFMIGRLNPVIVIDGNRYFVNLQELAALPRTRLSDVACSVKHQRADFVNAIDLLFTGI